MLVKIYQNMRITGREYMLCMKSFVWLAGLGLTLKQVFSFLYLTLKFDHEVFWVGKE